VNTPRPAATPLLGGTAPAPAATPPQASPRRLSSRELLGGRAEVEIEHDAQIYRLRRTALGKLILTK
jgi:hemin uptake protein HemP